MLGHGSAHLLFIQARLTGHSALTRHSGRHCGGSPMLLGKHVHAGCPLTERHLLFGPHGDGEQGSVGGSRPKKIYIILIEITLDKIYHYTFIL